MHYLYRITDTLNNKVYIGQAVNIQRRWTDHKWNAKQENAIQYISRAMNKYGISNFIFEVIATCRNQDDANEIESILIEQYNSRNKEYGYNIKPGGNNSPQAEETKEKIRQATIKQIAEKGHPAQGHKWSDEQKTNLSITLKALDKEAIYTEEVRQRMSEAHIGIKDSEETKQKKSESIKNQWQIRGNYDSKKCEAACCEVSGKAKYKIINGIRYCNKHGLRMLRYNRLDTLDS
jgi:group I intron endonuclease